MPERKTPRKSPSKPRILNRWDDDLDKGVLLCVQYACSEAGLKIPWARVAEMMGPSFTEGGIVQHLAKLRSLMILAEIPVPPSIKRGTITKSPSKIYGSAANPRIKLEPIAPLFPNGTSSVRIKQEEGAEEPLSIYERAKRVTDKLTETNTEEAGNNDAAEPEPTKEPVKSQAKSAGKPKSKSQVKNKGRRNSMSDDEEGEVPVLYDSDSDYSSPKKRRRTTLNLKKAAYTKAPAQALPSPTATPVEDPEEDNTMIKVEEEESGPATRTRGVKRDYSMMAAPSSDEIEPEPEEQGRVLEAEPQTEAQEPAVESANECDDDAEQQQVVETADEDSEHDSEADAEVDADEDEQEVDEDINVEMDDADSEAETERIDEGDAAVLQAQDHDPFSQPLQIVDTSYGQVFAAPQMMPAHRFDGAGGVHNFNRLDYMSPSYTGNLSLQYPYSNIAGLNYLPHGSTLANLTNMGVVMYTPSTQTSQNSSQAGVAGYSNMMSMPGTDFMNLDTIGIGQSGDVINEQDHVNSLPSGDIFFTQDGDYVIDS